MQEAMSMKRTRSMEGGAEEEEVVVAPAKPAV